MDAKNLQTLLEVGISVGCAGIGFWFYYIAALAAREPVRRCLRFWLGTTCMAVGLENFVDAMVPWNMWTPHVVALLIKFFVIWATLVVILRELPRAHVIHGD